MRNPKPNVEQHYRTPTIIRFALLVSPAMLLAVLFFAKRDDLIAAGYWR